MDGVARTKIILLGLRRSGKTSIQQVLFNSMVPKETFYLDATMRIVKHTYDTIIPLEIWDCPGNITVESLGAPLSLFSTLVFIIDIRDLYNQPISRLVEFIVAAYHLNPTINFEIFVHKAEKLQEDEKIENFRQINERVTDRLMDIAPEFEQQIILNFHLTSIFDHSLHQAFSRVLQKLTDSLPYLEDLLNSYCANSQASKVFLFDAQSRLHVATDLSPVDTATHNLCCDNLAMLNAFGDLYTSVSSSPTRRRRGIPEPSLGYSMATPPPSAVTLSVNGTKSTSSPSSSSPASPPLLSPPLARVQSHPTPSITSSSSSLHTTTTTSTTSHSQAQQQQAQSHPPQDLFYPSGATSLHPSSLPGTTIMWHLLTSSEGTGVPVPLGSLETSAMTETLSTIKPSTNPSLSSSTNSSSSKQTPSPSSVYPNPTLILLVLLPTAIFESRRGLVELNVVAVREGVQEIVDVEREVRGVGGGRR